MFTRDFGVATVADVYYYAGLIADNGVSIALALGYGTAVAYRKEIGEFLQKVKARFGEYIEENALFRCFLENGKLVFSGIGVQLCMYWCFGGVLSPSINLFNCVVALGCVMTVAKSIWMPELIYGM